jgi:tellurite resistance protein TehA-like permease
MRNLARYGAFRTAEPPRAPRPPWPDLGPNWFAAVMGTGIVATAAAGLPVPVAGLRAVAVVVWALAAAFLVILLVLVAVGWCREPQRARRHLLDPVLGHFYGAPAMALLTVGAGTLLVGVDVLGPDLALAVDVVLWAVGTLAGLTTAVLLPYVAVTRHRTGPDAAFGGWLMPVVPPMVSATTGAYLAPHLPAGQPRDTFLLACGVLFGISLLASLLVTSMIWARLVRHGVGAPAAAPTLFIVLGFLGQSVTAANVLAPQVPAPWTTAATAAGVLYGVLVWGFALTWLAVAGALVLHTARTAGLPFGLAWWSFTFPVGTVVTGSSALHARTGLVAPAAVAVVLFVGLVLAWVTVLTRTAAGVRDGSLLRPPAPLPAPRSEFTYAI